MSAAHWLSRDAGVLRNLSPDFASAPNATSALSSISVARGSVPARLATSSAEASSPTAVKRSSSTAVSSTRLS